jgi:hypothetical protein
MYNLALQEEISTKDGDQYLLTIRYMYILKIASTLSKLTKTFPALFYTFMFLV